MEKKSTMRGPRTTHAGTKKGPKGTNELTGSSRYRAAAQSRITHLRLRGTGEQIELPSIASYTVGREPAGDDPKEPRADVRLPSPRKGMSLVHARFEWRKDLLWCEDAGSTNGTHANYETKHDWFQVTSGMRIDFGDASVLAMDWRLTQMIEPLAWCLGLDAHEKIDRALGLVQEDGPLLLVGPRDSDQEWLARQIHEASRRRGQPFVAFTSKLGRDAEARLDAAGFGTVFVDLSQVGKVTASFAKKLFAGEGLQLKLRPIVTSVTHADSQRAFQQLGQGHTLVMPDVASRGQEILRMMDRLMMEAGSPVRIRDLGEPWMSRLAAHRFATLEEVREAEKRLRAWLETRNRTHAAERVGLSRQAFTQYMRRLLGDYLEQVDELEGKRKAKDTR
ncbi:MAG: sigma-54-dependent Fis family transcriptional regulator [Deltaproteobacteria bacterium]|nr:sigma-54-dependent Fis family transcriptional regulator [Kofleriaceae bacterium]